MRMIITTPIHIGDKTHNHDQLITFVSFSAINNIVSKPKKPTSKLLDVFLLIAFIFIT